MIKKISILIVLLISMLSSVFSVDIARSDNGQPQSVARISREDSLKARRAKIEALIKKRQEEAQRRAQQSPQSEQRTTGGVATNSGTNVAGSSAKVAKAAKADNPWSRPWYRPTTQAVNQSSAKPSTNQSAANNSPKAAINQPQRAPAQLQAQSPSPAQPSNTGWRNGAYQAAYKPNIDNNARNTAWWPNSNDTSRAAYKQKPWGIQSKPPKVVQRQTPPTSANGRSAYQSNLSNSTTRDNEPRVAGASQKEILLLKILKGDGVEISIQDAQNLADVVLDYGGVDSVRSGIFGTILDVRKADKEYRQIRDMFTEFLLQASRKECTKAVKLFEDVLKKLEKTMLHGMCADFISLTNFLHDHLLSDRIVKYRKKFLKKLNRLKMLDERIFIKGLITKVSEDDVECLTAELCGLIIHEARGALVSKSQRSEESKLAALRTIKKEIRIFITAFAIGHYKLAKASLRRIRTVAKMHGIEEFGNKFLSHVMSFPAVNLILRNTK